MSMKELRVCIESALPDEEGVLEKLGVDVENDAYRIIETDVPFRTDIKVNTSVWRLNNFSYPSLFYTVRL